MFNDQEFESGQEFTSDFLSNINSRLYLPDNNIIEYGENFSELMMIQDGIVNLYIRYKDKQEEESSETGKLKDYHFFILPTFSYFGDYQILYDLKSQLTYKSGEMGLLITMCLKKDKFIEIMNDYPEARKFYMDRAWKRRIEFRRR